jgi:excisionase family DNA binding protein
MEPLLLTVEEAAKVMSLGRTRIYDLIASHELESLKVGKSRRIVAKSIERFIERNLGIE